MNTANQTRDHERMVAVARGDLSSMNEIYRNRHRPLFRFFFRMTGGQATAEDLVHEVFLRMLRYRHTCQTEGEEAEGCFEAWMYRIARNTLADNARKFRHEISAGPVELDENRERPSHPVRCGGPPSGSRAPLPRPARTDG